MGAGREGVNQCGIMVVVISLKWLNITVSLPILVLPCTLFTYRIQHYLLVWGTSYEDSLIVVKIRVHRKLR